MENATTILYTKFVSTDYQLLVYQFPGLWLSAFRRLFCSLLGIDSPGTRKINRIDGIMVYQDPFPGVAAQTNIKGEQSMNVYLARLIATQPLQLSFHPCSHSKIRHLSCLPVNEFSANHSKPTGHHVSGVVLGALRGARETSLDVSAVAAQVSAEFAFHFLPGKALHPWRLTQNWEAIC